MSFLKDLKSKIGGKSTGLLVHVFYFAVQWHDTKDVVNEIVSAPTVHDAIESLQVRLRGHEGEYGIISVTRIR